MKKSIIFSFALIVFQMSLIGQNIGDTITTPTFNYLQTKGYGIRDTMINFPNLTGVTYEKIYMLYNIRCKHGLVGSGVTPSGANGCGEWDYSCQTYITDSSKVDSAKVTHPNYSVSGFSGSVYKYTTLPSYTYYQYLQQQTVHTSTISEIASVLGTGTLSLNRPFNTTQKSSKTQYLYTVAELVSAGLTAGNVSSIKLNVTNSGPMVQYLKIKMKPSIQTVLDASKPDLTGFTEVYNNNTALTNGLNEFNFSTNFNWDGVSNVLVEFNFTNSNNTANTTVLGSTLSQNMGLITNGNDYYMDFNGSNYVNIANTALANITNSITITFWAKGNPAYLPANTSILHSVDGGGNRQLNIHFPWSDANIYFDCGAGATGASYDRINKVATAAEYKGNWNHWAFTKNATAGTMNIYLNGVLWQSGTAKTKAMVMVDLLLGTNDSKEYNYFGKADELTIWNTALTQTTIAAWMNKTVTAAHPNYASLIGYYPFNEGTGNTSTDQSSYAQTSHLIGPTNWGLFRGNDIVKNFTETMDRPNVTFVQGVYAQTTTTTSVKDSVENFKTAVYHFGTANNNLISIDTNYYYNAGYTYVYNGETGVKIDSVMIASTGTITISDLNYYQFSPSRFQITSFVTPYGNGLNLGLTGKTFIMDVSDFAPILKGWKRMTIEGGGQWQEDMDIKFMYIVGTPPRTVKDIKQVWKIEEIAYTNILNDFKCEPRSVHLDASASSFKMRSMITGHGQEGEFIPQTHYIDIAGGTHEFEWTCVKTCGENPIYPQGGTWIYDRAGWCPGMQTNLQESDLTPFVTPGSNAVIDYGINTASGDSRYFSSNQLVSYGAPNFALDAAIVEIKSPTTLSEYGRLNPICHNPTIQIQNTGSTPLTSAKIEYWVNGNTNHETYNWTGNLNFLEKADVVLPSGSSLWSGMTGTVSNKFNAKISNPNGGADGYSYNNMHTSSFGIPAVIPNNFYVFFKSNLAASETDYKIMNDAGVTIFSRTNMTNSTIYKDTFNLPLGCYTLLITDTGGDGISFWANSAGTGACIIKKVSNGFAIKTLQPDFGNSLKYDFSIDYPLAIDDLEKDSNFSLYPNPAQNEFMIETENVQSDKIVIYNSIGQKVTIPFVMLDNKLVYNCQQIKTGIYFVEYTDKTNLRWIRKIVITK